MKLGSYAKSIVALVGFVLTTAGGLDWGFEFPSWVPALTSLLTAVTVYLVPNEPYERHPDYVPDRVLPDDTQG